MYIEIGDRNGKKYLLETEAGDEAGTIRFLSSKTAASENHIGEVGGRAKIATATFARPADVLAYASGDLVANSTVAGAVTPLSFAVARVAAGSGMVRRVAVRKTGTAVANASFRLHLYSASPVVSNGDNGVYLTDKAANYMGRVDVVVDQAFTDGAVGTGVPAAGLEVNFALAAGQNIYGVLEARGAYTPVSGETFTVDLEVLQN